VEYQYFATNSTSAVLKLALISNLDNAGWTPLHEACNYGNTECVQEILQRCPEVDLLTQVDGVTPLHDALSNGHVEIGKLLLQRGGECVPVTGLSGNYLGF
jgi:ankyrin repeat protein